jgi:hypothetical protein
MLEAAGKQVGRRKKGRIFRQDNRMEPAFARKLRRGRQDEEGDGCSRSPGKMIILPQIS